MTVAGFHAVRGIDGDHHPALLALVELFGEYGLEESEEQQSEDSAAECEECPSDGA